MQITKVERKELTAYIDHHEHIVPLLIPNRKLPLRLTVILGKAVQLLDCLVLQHRREEFAVLLCILVTRLTHVSL